MAAEAGVCPFEIQSARQIRIGLIPRQTEVPREIGIFRAVGLEEAVLYGENVKREPRLDSIQIQDECVILLAANNLGEGPRLLKRIGAQAVHDRRVR